jgi:acyl-CoA reductase-like NAD-dependent aldehyde dehydrogenase
VLTGYRPLNMISVSIEPGTTAMNKPHATPTADTGNVEQVRGLFIDGAEQKIGERETFPVVSPGTGKIIARATQATEEDVRAAVKSAHQAFSQPDWKKLSERTRAKLVYKLGDELEKHLDELYELETLNNGRPTRETRAQGA